MKEVLDSIKSRALIPSSQSTFSDSDMVDFATDILKTRIVPFILKHDQERGEVLKKDPQVPPEFRPILAQAVAAQILESLGFLDKASAAYQTLARMESDIIPLITSKKQRRVVNGQNLVWYS